MSVMTEAMRRLNWRCAALAAFAWLSACSYTTRRPELSLGGVKAKEGEPLTLMIPVIDNDTSRTGVEAQITNVFRRVIGGAEGVRLVHQPEQARFMLLAKLQKWDSRVGPTLSSPGNPGSALSGGLDDRQQTAGDLLVGIELDVQLIERLNTGVQRLIWRRPFLRNATYAPSVRHQEATGSSSAPYINMSRERIVMQGLIEGMAQEVLEQATADF